MYKEIVEQCLRGISRARFAQVDDNEINYMRANYVNAGRSMEDYCTDNLIRDALLVYIFKSANGYNPPIEEIDHWWRTFAQHPEIRLEDYAISKYNDTVKPLKDEIQRMIDNPTIKEVIKEVKVEVPVEKIVEKEVIKEVKVPAKEMTNLELLQTVLRRIGNAIKNYIEKIITTDKNKGK